MGYGEAMPSEVYCCYCEAIIAVNEDDTDAPVFFGDWIACPSCEEEIKVR